MSEFSVGDRVSVFGHYDKSPREISTIVKITEKKMVLKNGSEWTANGMREWGHSRTSWYTGPYVREYQDGDDKRLIRRRALNFVENFSRWYDLSDEVLVGIYQILNPDTSKEG